MGPQSKMCRISLSTDLHKFSRADFPLIGGVYLDLRLNGFTCVSHGWWYNLGCKRIPLQSKPPKKLFKNLLQLELRGQFEMVKGKMRDLEIVD